MVQLVRIEIKELPAFEIVGKAITVRMDEENPVPAFWSRCFADGTFAAIEQHTDFLLEDAYVGWMADYDPAQNTFTYVCGMMVKAGCPVPEGQAARSVAPCKTAVGWIQGPDQEVFAPAHTLTQQALEQAGYQVDYGAGWSMELYQCPRFTTPDDQGRVILDYYIPVIPQA